MKKILITGANSYIGMSFEHYLSQWPEKYQVDTVDMVDGSWRQKSFAGYDSVYHVAGIAHSDTGKVSDERKAFYYKINTELTIETARKAKEECVPQFIFMSSATVYGESATIGQRKTIEKDTPPHPANFYGNSKLLAEEGLLALADESFKVVVLRPPMIYGPRCKGNYPTLSKLARKLPIFPWVDNKKSMLYVEHLMEFVRLMVENEEQGIFWPQNEEYTNTTEMVQYIAQLHGKKILVVRHVGWALKIVGRFTGLVNKAFGTLCYEKQMSVYKEPYCKYSLKDTIKITEKGHL